MTCKAKYERKHAVMRINKTLKYCLYILAIQTTALSGSLHASASAAEYLASPSRDLCNRTDSWKTRLARTEVCFPINSSKSEWMPTLSKQDARDLSKYCILRNPNSPNDCGMWGFYVGQLVEHVPKSCKSVLRNHIDMTKTENRKAWLGKSYVTQEMMKVSMARKGCPLYAGVKPWDTLCQPEIKPFQIGEVKTFIRPGGSQYGQWFSYQAIVTPNCNTPKSVCLFIDGQPYNGVTGPQAEYPYDSSPKQNCNNSDLANSYKNPTFSVANFDFSLKEYPGAVEGDRHMVFIRWEFDRGPPIASISKSLVFTANGRWAWSN